ncbi:MAG: family 20 glycosylhydrolase [Phycisphaerae bacterium]|nr:family 20 glycosylhydrolase [Phycisphaerae bacterium]
MITPNLFLLVLCLCGQTETASVLSKQMDDRPTLLPRPLELEAGDGSFVLGAASRIVYHPDGQPQKKVAEQLATWVEAQTGHRLPVGPSSGGSIAPQTILLTTDNADESLGMEGYQLVVEPAGIVLRASSAAGLFYASQTLRQMLPSTPLATQGTGNDVSIPAMRIRDRPRFQWRGLLLDCSRHFMTKEFVKRYIDLLAFHKLNVLHWHLTDDQGWRIEIKKYPKLTEVGAWRNEGGERYGGFYTQDDIREIVAYATERHVLVVPEIEMPGHCMATLASYPELSCTGGPFTVGTHRGVYKHVYCVGNDQTFEFLENVLSEIVDLFPGEFVHIGGDECTKARWHECPKCEARLRNEGLCDESELESYFVRRISRFLRKKDRRIIGWDETLLGNIEPDAVIQSWRGMGAAVTAAWMGHDVIVSPTSHCYLDFPYEPDPAQPSWLGVISLHRMYQFEPIPHVLSEAHRRHILGAEAAVWTEHIPQDDVDGMVFPRLCAFAEVMWSPEESRDWADFAARMQRHYDRLDALGVTYYVRPPQVTTEDRAFTDSLVVELSNPNAVGEIRYTLDGSPPTAESPLYEGLILLRGPALLKARTFWPNGRASAVVEAQFDQQRLRPAETLKPSLPGLIYGYYEGPIGHMPDVDGKQPLLTGIAERIDLTPRQRDESYALVFNGSIKVPSDGVYTFYLHAEDECRLCIGTQAVVVNEEGNSISERLGQIALAAGCHPIMVLYRENVGAGYLRVLYKGPGIAKQTIPANTLFHAPGPY